MDAPAALADYVVSTCGEDLAVEVFEALAHPDMIAGRARRRGSTGATTGGLAVSRRVLRLHRFRVTRRAVVAGLAARFGCEVPRLIEGDREYGRRRTRDGAITRAARHFGDRPGAGGQPSHRRASA